MEKPHVEDTNGMQCKNIRIQKYMLLRLVRFFRIRIIADEPRTDIGNWKKNIAESGKERVPDVGKLNELKNRKIWEILTRNRTVG